MAIQTTTATTTIEAQYEIILMTISVNCHLRARNVVVLREYCNLPCLEQICILNESSFLLSLLLLLLLFCYYCYCFAFVIWSLNLNLNAA